MTEHPNAAVVRSAYESFSQGKIDSIFAALLSTTPTVHIPGRSPVAGDHNGRDGILALLGRFGELSGNSFSLELHDVLATDDHAVALHRVTAARDDRQLDDVGAIVFHIADSKIANCWFHPYDLYGWDGFWS